MDRGTISEFHFKSLILFSSSIFVFITPRYAPQDIFNIDKVGLFYRDTSKSTLKGKGDNCVICYGQRNVGHSDSKT